MPGISSIDADSAVSVVVTPSQSSYFAGETFSVTVTFTNTRTPESGPSRPHGHKRGAHSISSAPIARPPTSPGTPRTPVQPAEFLLKNIQDVPVRRGVIGRSLPKDTEDLPELIEQRRKRLLAKSSSVTIAPHELEEQLGEAGFAQASVSANPRFTPPLSSSRVSSPLARLNSFSLGSGHPHARKQSVFDVELITTSSSETLYTPSTSTSTFSLALDPITEGVLSPYPSTPSTAPSPEPSPGPNLPHRISSATDTVYAYIPPPPKPPRRHAQIGLNHPQSRSTSHLQPPRNAFSSTFPRPNAELILYSYAQLKGTLILTTVPGTHPTPEQRHTLNTVRAALLKRSVVGGGRMDITPSLHQSPPPATQHHPHRRRATHGRSSSFSASLLSLLSPTYLVSSATSTSFGTSSPFTPAYDLSKPSISGLSPAPSPLSDKFLVTGNPTDGSPSPSGVGLGLSIPGVTAAVADEEIDPDVPLPTFEVQPVMLAVDLSLSPGESKSYTYSVLLPDNLPPTFKGRSLRFSYELLVGTCRAGSGGTGSASANSVSRVMKVPIRVYNHVSVGRSTAPYDLLWPVLKSPPNSASPEQGQVVEDTLSGKGLRKIEGSMVPSPSTSSVLGGSFEDLQDYAHRLLSSFAEPSGTGGRVGPKLPAESISPVPQQSTLGNGDGSTLDSRLEERRRLEREMEWMDEGGLTGCSEAVEILTRNPKKASYDVNKDGVKVAVLTFAKAAYRLGETVLGVVELNERVGRARVLQLSAMLEAHESLPSTLSSPTPSSRQHLRRVHAEYHSSFTASTLRTTFSLDIPSDASPAFQVRIAPFDHFVTPTNPNASKAATGGLEWKVRLCLLVAVAKEEAEVGTEGARIKQLVRDGPRGEWGSSWRAPSKIAPMEKLVVPSSQMGKSPTQTWTQFFASAVNLLGVSEAGEEGAELGSKVAGEKEVEYDGVKPDMAGGIGEGINFGGGEEGWTDIKVETVECEVPVGVWPGNTAFKAADVIFGV